MIIQKFGGSILSSSEDFQRVSEVITPNSIVVVSAVHGITDILIQLINQAIAKKDFHLDLKKLNERHKNLAAKELPEIDTVFAELERLLTGISYTGETSDRLNAKILSRGEYLSALILHSYSAGSSFIPSEKLGIIAEGSYANARCDFEKTKINFPANAQVITTGFYAPNPEGEICLFGRGGSDYAAASLARAVKADKVEFWKNVDGFLTADPQIVADAKFISEISFDEASEICRFGAKILHPSALEPLFNTNIPVEIKNILKPSSQGTKIYENSKKNEIAAVTGRKNIAAISVSGNEMVEAFGIAAKILTHVANANVPVDVIATGKANISFTVEQLESDAALHALSSLKQFKIKAKKHLALVGIIGDGIKENSAFMSRVLSVLSKNKIRLEMVSQGASELDLSLVIDEKDYEKAVQAIHKEFFGG